MYYWDRNGGGHWQGIGSDRGHVKMYRDEDGAWQSFDLLLTTQPEYSRGDWSLPKMMPSADKTTSTTLPKELQFDEDTDKGTITCPICGHTEQYNPDASATRNLARGRMAKHCNAPKMEHDAHRELYYEEFPADDTAA